MLHHVLRRPVGPLPGERPVSRRNGNWAFSWSTSRAGKTRAEVIRQHARVCTWPQHRDQEFTCRTTVWLTVEPIPVAEQLDMPERYYAKVREHHLTGVWEEGAGAWVTQREAKEHLEELAIERWGR